MLSIESSPKAWLHQIYLNLGNFAAGSPHHYKVEFSYNHLMEQTSAPYQVQVSLPESFREFLIRESGLYQYQVKNPLELAPELRTQRWQNLCEHLTNYSELSKSTQVKVIKLLSSLCFHQAVLEYVPPISAVEIANDVDSASLALSRAMSDFILHSDRYLPYNFKDLETIAQNAPLGHLARITAGLQILVELAKTFKDLEGAKYWRSIVNKEIESTLPSLHSFTSGLLMSVYYRAAVFVPLLEKDQDTVIAEMDLCQSYAESLIPENQEQQIIAYENLNIIGESRTKEALWLRDFDLAEERARKLVERDILDPRYRLELGEVLLKRGRVEEAAQAYRSATRLGPPGTAVGWFMAGQCYQSLGELQVAYDCYLTCLHYDPLAISAIKRLYQLTSYLGDEKVSGWCELRLSQLEQEKHNMTAKGSNLPTYIPAVPTPMQAV
ncbi:MAG: tetratricopeptide repeat protein [Nostoc sp. TH1S01]|nr:tetratricopeptide repeat protein [Nostoc sp. TH1S01]